MLHRETVSENTFRLLEEITKHNAARNLALAGGTSLSLQIGHRISYDLDFFGEFNENELKGDLLFKYKYPLLNDINVIEGLRLFALQDIAAMKLEAIKGRGRKRDFYDLYYLLRLFDLSKMIEFNKVKFKSSNEFLIKKSLTYFVDAENDPEIVFPNNVEIVSWGKVKSKISEELAKLL
ncbi:MAG: nucleotidyl transferase AbiEii/AbiGii toxin family protein [Vicingaceae bacterium]